MARSQTLCGFSEIAACRLLAEKMLLSDHQRSAAWQKGPMNYNLVVGFGRKSYRVPHRGLMICFAIGWGLLTILVMAQDHAIDSQRELIQLLLQDLHEGLVTTVDQPTTSSAPIAAKQSQLPFDQVQPQSASSPQTPSYQVQSNPSSKVQSNAKGFSPAPSSQEKTGANPARNSRRAARPLPVRPPAQVTDPLDMRRVRFSI